MVNATVAGILAAGMWWLLQRRIRQEQTATQEIR